jgi:hypothetical protein
MVNKTARKEKEHLLEFTIDGPNANNGVFPTH